MKKVILSCCFLLLMLLSFAQSRGLVISDESGNSEIMVGKYYALVIGTDKYDSKNVKPLEHAVSDATNLYNTLNKDYLFDSVKLLTNATRNQILKSLSGLKKVMTDDDNLLIFYAGHGYENKEIQQGYWLPKDAEIDDPSNWISNSDIADQLNSIKSKHKLVISDACFSGGIFTAGTRAVFMDEAAPHIQSLYNSKSCTAMTSGAHTEVPDESAFMHGLLTSLKNNSESFRSARSLFNSFYENVMSSGRNRNLIPQYGPVLSSANDGGDFVFIRKVNTADKVNELGKSVPKNATTDNLPTASTMSKSNLDLYANDGSSINTKPSSTLISGTIDNSEIAPLRDKGKGYKIPRIIKSEVEKYEKDGWKVEPTMRSLEQ